MILIYITLSSHEQARQVARALLEKRLIACANWFPISSAYRWKGELVEDTEIVLIAKTLPEYYDAVTKEVRQHVNYTNFIAQLDVPRINDDYAQWMKEELCAQSEKLQD